MSQTLYDRYRTSTESQAFAETPFADRRNFQTGETPADEALVAEAFTSDSEVSSPFIASEWSETDESPAAAPEMAALAELATEMKDSEFREALEQLADEALEIHAEQLAGAYGDRETRDSAAERLLNEHFQPLAMQTGALLDRLFERLEGYEAEALTETEFDRIATEVLPGAPTLTPASEQFLGGIVRKVGRLVRAPIKLIGKGIGAVAKLAVGPLLGPLKKLARYLLGHVVKFATNKIPERYRPLARKLSERLFHELGDTHESEAEEHEQSEALPAGPDIARLEAEFDLHAAQLLLTPDAAEAEHMVSSYGEAMELESHNALAALDAARAELAGGLARLDSGESAQPLMEQFLPAIAAVWPAVKAAEAIIGRPKVVKFVGGLLGKLVEPLIGAEGARIIGPPIADVGLRLFGFESAAAEPRAVATEALAATIEEAATRLMQQPRHIFENETLLDTAVREAFEASAAANFPAAMIRPELREAPVSGGMWRRQPPGSPRQRYAKFTETPAVTLPPRVAAGIETFDGNSLHDHIQDRMHLPPGQTVKTNVRLYKALPGARVAAIARAEGIPPGHLHPLTPQAAGALLGPNAGLGQPAPPHGSPAPPNRLSVHQRLYYLEPPGGRQHVHQRQHVRLARQELLINLRSGEIKLWLYLSERLSQRIAAELGKPQGTTGAFRLIHRLAHRAAAMLRSAILSPTLPAALRVVGESPHFERTVPSWLVQVGRPLAARLEAWASHQLAHYLRSHAEAFRRASATQHDGVTLRLTMTRLPGIDTIRMVARGRLPPHLKGGDWLNGEPAFAVHALPGHAIR